LAGTGAIGVAFGAYINFLDFENLLAKIITKDTASLAINHSEIHSFIKDASNAGIWNMYSPAKRELIKWSYYLDNPLINLPYHTKYRRYRSEIVGFFLLSTNFFQNKMNSDKVIKYISLYDPYKTPCSNPFSNQFYSQ